MKFNLSLDIAIIISLITVFLFANGNAYLGGYLHFFNIDPLVLNFSIQDKIYIGYLNGFLYLLYFVFFIITYITLKIIYSSLYLDSMITNLIEKISSTKTLKKATFSIQPLESDKKEQIYSNHIFFIIIMFFLILTLSLLSKTEKEAEKEAKKQLEKLEFIEVSLKNSEKKEKYLYIRCGSNLCALLSKEKKNIILEEPKNLIFSLKQ